jgi:hypothetical protein
MRPAVVRGSLILVGGHSRGVGKTQFIERWIRARVGEPWVAVKVSAHRHAAAGVDVPLAEETLTASMDTQTGRYLSAGATRAFLLRATDASLARAAAFIDALLAQGANVIVESNRLVRHLRPHSVFFLVRPGVDDWKASSAEVLRVPHVVICCHLGGPCHDSSIVTPAVGDHAALRADSLHRVALSRAAAQRVS